jgi:hypothetical protein
VPETKQVTLTADGDNDLLAEALELMRRLREASAKADDAEREPCD